MSNSREVMVHCLAGYCGQYCWMGVSRSSFPSSTSRRAAVAVIHLVMEAVRNMLCESTGTFSSRSALPKVAVQTWPSLATAMERPGRLSLARLIAPRARI